MDLPSKDLIGAWEFGYMQFVPHVPAVGAVHETTHLRRREHIARNRLSSFRSFDAQGRNHRGIHCCIPMRTVMPMLRMSSVVKRMLQSRVFANFSASAAAEIAVFRA